MKRVHKYHGWNGSEYKSVCLKTQDGNLKMGYDWSKVTCKLCLKKKPSNEFVLDPRFLCA